MRTADRQPPQDLESERRLIGGLLIMGAFADVGWTVDDVAAIVRPAMFYLNDHVLIVTAIFEAQGEPVDAVTIERRLQETTPRDNLYWAATLLALADEGEPANGVFYARMVRAAWQRRELIRVALEAVDGAFDLTTEFGDTVATLAQRVDTIEAAGVADREPMTESDLLRALPNPTDAAAAKIPVALGQLGRILGGGLDRGTLTVIGALPSCGKTSLGLGLCMHAARASDGCPSFFASLEMTSTQVGQRLLSMRCRLPVTSLRSGDIDAAAFNVARNKAALEADGDRTIFVLDGIRDLRAIVASAKRLARKHDVGLAVVDYLGLAFIGGEYERNDLRIGAMTGLLKALAVDAGIAVVLLSQLNRQSATEARAPRLSDLRDSGLIEADADNVLLIHKGRNVDGSLCDTGLIVAKQRQGDIGEALIQYDRRTMAYQARLIEAEQTLCKGTPF